MGLSYSNFTEATHTRSQGLDADGNVQPDVTLSGPGLSTFQIYGSMRFELSENMRMFFGLSATATASPPTCSARVEHSM